ncbi:hypothetical protein E1263_20510 [Kribbella antibiotica]|uniref:Uncharacterized protein n=1 Tax=Kribbella antibiotica TaxID=190195 RepID=A0A4R4ZJZ4_9ACTN|nr:hypothetical protein [Kribbella antibiotica]TDD58124.1 hypothetical protein E1263_20510 [Kribbella antibiotica]
MTAAPSEAAVLYPGRYNRVTNCYKGIIDKPALMAAEAFCKGMGDGSYFSIYKTAKGDKYNDFSASRFNRVGNCYQAILSDDFLRITKHYCRLIGGKYEQFSSEGPYTG